MSIPNNDIGQTEQYPDCKEYKYQLSSFVVDISIMKIFAIFVISVVVSCALVSQNDPFLPFNSMLFFYLNEYVVAYHSKQCLPVF